VEIIFSNHSLDKIKERGTNKEEIEIAIRLGERVPAKKGRIAFRKNFNFENHWKGRYYQGKQMMPVIVEEGNNYVVITVYVFFIGGEK